MDFWGCMFTWVATIRLPRLLQNHISYDCFLQQYGGTSQMRNSEWALHHWHRMGEIGISLEAPPFLRSHWQFHLTCKMHSVHDKIWWQRLHCFIPTVVQFWTFPTGQLSNHSAYSAHTSLPSAIRWSLVCKNNTKERSYRPCNPILLLRLDRSKSF